MTQSLSISAFIQHVQTIIVSGEAKFFDADICPMADENWTMAVRFLESEGWSIGAITDASDQPVFVAETNNKSLTGFELTPKKIIKIVVQRVGLPLRSLAPQAPKHTEPGLNFVPHHTMALCLGDTKTKQYSAPIFLPTSQIGFGVADNTAFQYGQSAFEGGCAMIDPLDDQQALLFRIEQNAARFQTSCQALGLPTLAVEVFVQTCERLIKSNQSYLPKKNGKMYIRPSVVGLHGGLGINIPRQCLITFEVAAFGDYLPAGITVEALLDTHRPPTGGDKISPNYGGSFVIKQDVKKRGYHDFMSFDHSGNIEEVSTCAVGCLKKNSIGDFEYIFPLMREEDPDPKTAKTRHSLSSITRKSIIDILERLGKTVIRRDIHYTEIEDLDGVFTMGNAVGVIQVQQLDVKPRAESPVLFSKKLAVDPAVNKTVSDLKNYLYQARQGQCTDPRLVDLNENWVRRIAF